MFPYLIELRALLRYGLSAAAAVLATPVPGSSALHAGVEVESRGVQPHHCCVRWFHQTETVWCQDFSVGEPPQRLKQLSKRV